MNTIEEIAEKLARAIGHAPDCKKSRAPTPCDCGAAGEQAEAIDLYEHWKEKRLDKFNKEV